MSTNMMDVIIDNSGGVEGSKALSLMAMVRKF
jgi:hypothetical protein